MSVMFAEESAGSLLKKDYQYNLGNKIIKANETDSPGY
jgi:hypothetical protein